MFERLLTNRMLSLSVASLLIAAVVVLMQLPGLGSALLAPGINDDTTPEMLKTSLEDHAKDTALYRDRFLGRSIFFMPPAPRNEIVVKPPEDTGPPVPEPPPPPPEIPVEYGGPDILALLGDQVHVAGPKILKLGKEDSSLGLTVLEFVPPWSVRVQWLKKPGNYAAGTYVVELFQSDDAVLSRESTGGSTPEGLTQASDQAAVVPAAGGRRSGSAELTED